MPIGPYPTFEACVIDQQKKGHNKESAQKICGEIEKRNQSESFHIFNEVSFELSDNGFDPNTEFEILTSDKQYDSRYGNFKYTEKELQEAADNFNNDIRGVEIAVDINHDMEKKAYAWIKPGSMRVGPSTKLSGKYSLYCKLYRYTPEGMELMKTGAYRYFSVEIISQWKRFKDGVKKVFKNVILGLALTNSPVIKDMAPTFSEDDHNILINSNNMETFKIYLSTLDNKEVVSAEEKATLSKMLAELSEEEKAEVQETVDTVTEKPEEVESEEGAEEGVEEGGAAPAELSEVRNELSETRQELSMVKEKLRKEEMNKSAEQFMLSEDMPTGFAPKDKNVVVDFMLSLSDAQIADFKKVFGLIRSVRLGESGAAAEADKSDAAKEVEANKLAETIAKEKGISKWEALSEAYDQLNMVQ